MADADAPPKELPTEFKSVLAALKVLFARSLWRAKANSSDAAWLCISAAKSSKTKIQVIEDHFCKWREDSVAAIREWLPMYDELAKAHAELIEGDPLHWVEGQIWDRIESMCGAQRLSDMHLRPISRNVVWWFAVATQGNYKVNLHKPQKPWVAPRWLARNRKQSDWLLRLRSSDLSMRFHGAIEEELMKASLKRGLERPGTVLPTSDAQLPARVTGQPFSPEAASISTLTLPGRPNGDSADPTMEFINRGMRQSEGQRRLLDNFWLEQQEEHRRKMERIDREIERARELEHARKLAEIKSPETPSGAPPALASQASPNVNRKIIQEPPVPAEHTDLGRSTTPTDSRTGGERLRRLTKGGAKGRPPSVLVSTRRKVILAIAETGVEGVQYCEQLDVAGLSTPLEWQKSDGCPKKYLDAWNVRDAAKRAKWRHRIADEKSKATALSRGKDPSR